MTDTKRCTKCGQDKPRAEFYPHPHARDRLFASCGECCRQEKRDRWVTDPAYRVRQTETVRRGRVAAAAAREAARDRWAAIAAENEREAAP